MQEKIPATKCSSSQPTHPNPQPTSRRRRRRAQRRAKRLQTQTPPDPTPISAPVPDWIHLEFAHADLGDQRLRPRLDRIAADLARQPQASIPQACGSWSRTQAAYRFFDNDLLSMDNLLASHHQATLERVRPHPVVLVAQDTCFLNFSPHPATEGLGPIGSSAEGTIGLVLHTALALTPQGEPLGLLDAQCWARDPKQFGQKHARRERPIEEKESAKWLESMRAVQSRTATLPGTRWVQIGDCESDVYEFLALARSLSEQSAVLVRARHDRAMAPARDGDKPARLFAFLHAQPVAARITVTVPRRPGQKQRLATLEVRFASVTLLPPQGKTEQGSLAVWAVEAQEVHAPKNVAPICWRLVTTLPVTSAAEAVEKVQWYAQRWRIEEWHRILKSGCRVEDRQLQTAARLQRLLAVQMVVAWRILQMTKLARGEGTSQWPATTVVSEGEWEVLYVYFHQRRPSAGWEPTVREVVRWIGRLGGHLGRKRDGEPGPMVLWRGLHRLNDLMLGAELATIKRGNKHV